MKYTCSMETVQQNGRFTLFLVNSTLIYILFFLGKNLKINDIYTNNIDSKIVFTHIQWKINIYIRL